jgi:23S rRNA pseudouridine2604 synthase
MDKPPANPSTPDEGLRLSRVVAAQVPCSRREAEQYIAEGWVRVDGQPADLPQMRVTADQRIEVDPKARLQAVVLATFLIHKPAGMATAAAVDLLGAAGHWRDDRSGIRPSKAHHGGLKALLPLPTQASGLCVFSQDYRVQRKLTEDAAFIEQELVADVKGTMTADGLARLGHGLTMDGRSLPPARVSWQSETRLRFATKGIDPAWIEGMCAQVGLELCALRRIRIGRVAMAGLPLQQWRYLPLGERF